MSKKKKFRVSKRTLLGILGVVLLLAAAAGVGFWLRTAQNNNTKDTGASEQAAADAAHLPLVVKQVQDLQSQGKTTEASKVAQDAIDKSDTSNDVKYMLYIQIGNAKANSDDLKGAIEQYQKALSIKETYEVTSILGDTYQRLGDKTNAIAMYKRALPLVPKNALAEGEKEAVTMKIQSLGGTP